MPRDELCFLFWPDTPDATARRNLVVLLNHLRRALPAPEALVTADGAVSLDPALAQPDTAIAAAATAAGLRERRLDHLTAAVALYRGPGAALPPPDRPAVAETAATARAALGAAGWATAHAAGQALSPRAWKRRRWPPNWRAPTRSPRRPAPERPSNRP